MNLKRINFVLFIKVYNFTYNNEELNKINIKNMIILNIQLENY